MSAVTDTHSTKEKLWETVFTMRFVPRLYSEGKWEKLARARVEAGSNTSTVALRVVGSDEK
jgi:hypothetical protein